MAGVFAATQVDFVAYLAIRNTLNGPQAAAYDAHLIQYVCWAIENSVALDSAEFAVWCARAKAEVKGTNSAQLNTTPATDTI
jgi:hypothetical protein